MPYNSCRTCLTNRMESISCHIMPLVTKSLGGGHTHTLANTHTDYLHRFNFKKPGARRRAPGLKMKEFAEAYGFHHITTSPYYPWANGQAEHTVYTMKNLLYNAEDPHMALLSYCATPLEWCGLSPAELLMGCKIRIDLPQPKSSHIPMWTHTQNLKELHDKYKSVQQKYSIITIYIK